MRGVISGLVFGAALAGVTLAPADDAALVLRADVLHAGEGNRVEDAVVIVRGGRIEAIGSKLDVPESARVIAVPGAEITPGLIDANAWIEPSDVIPSTLERAPTAPDAKKSPGLKEFLHRLAKREHPDEHEDECPVCSGHVERPAGFASGVVARAASEQSEEVVPHTRLVDTLDLASPDFTRLLRGGVTTVYASPDPSSVIGPRGAILKTSSGPSSGGKAVARVIDAAAAVKATMGDDPSYFGSYNRRPSRYGSASLYVRRPTTRMGVTWVFRKAFHDTIARTKGIPVRGADTPSPDASKVLARVIAGETPLRIQARTLADITTATRLAAEFDLRFTLEEGTEAYRAIDVLKARLTPVIFGPIYDRGSGRRQSNTETERSRLFTFTALVNAGVDTALSAQDLRGEDGLARQAMYARRYGSSFDQTLRAVTSTPARLLGIDGDVGTLEQGKQADLVLWSGRPFAATSMPLVVVVDGEVALDRRRQEKQE